MGADFSRIGLQLWRALEGVEPTKTSSWKNTLTTLNIARNAIAHAEDGPLVTLRRDGYPITLATTTKWQHGLDQLTLAMDDVVAGYLDGLFGNGRPW